MTTSFQTAYPLTPHSTVAARNAGDVLEAVRTARTHDRPITVINTGHGLVGPATDAVVIDVSAFDQVHVDPERRTAKISAGTRWRQVIDAAAEYGLAPLSGSAPDIGAVSYVLGGGLGLLAREFGYAADHVRSIDVVTADGEPRHVTDGPLFWALRGGGGNFGVVTEMEVDLVAVQRIHGGGLYFDCTPELLTAWLRWTSTLPDECSTSLAVLPMPDVPGPPPQIRGRYVAHVRVASTVEVDTATLTAVATPLLGAVGPMDFRDSTTICNDPAQPHAYRGDNAYVADLTPATLTDLAAATGPAAPFFTVLQVNHLGGALAGRPETPNAVGNRDARFLVRVLSTLGPQSLAQTRELHDKALSTIAPGTLGRSLNFLFGDTGEDYVRSAFDAADLPRLAELKRRYDPDNLLRCQHTIPA